MGTDIAIDIAARLSGATTEVAGRVTGAIRDAARQTGAGFEYLLNTALRESNLNPSAKAKTSSATGLFQFIDQTWLGTMKQSGAALGYGKYADAISKTPQGRYVVNDPAMRKRDLRAAQGSDRQCRDGGRVRQLQRQGADRPPRAQADRRRTLHRAFPRRFRRGAFHQRGAGAAGRESDKLLPARGRGQLLDLLRQAGRGKSLKQVYAGLIAKHDVIGNSRFAVANAGGREVRSPPRRCESAKPATGSRRARSGRRSRSHSSRYRAVQAGERDRAGQRAKRRSAAAATNVAAAKAVTPVESATATLAPGAAGVAPQVAAAFGAEPKPQSSGPMFQTLFHEGERGAVAPVVRELWGAPRRCRRNDG